ncbi:MAG TPA: o-succinylbenzoate synthase [Segeticoccus sp.]|uniref:o-succinylbenzoate synthase n=1 Tax=Segeticoccus sp. TaxID=2706531 RepID=UPI002D7EA0E4|nr:o-succinylbenzoate synthase [Segeticoccus sp.]HET8601085.1 o-succinylbenzoate synthase [Segeticoccus sp.]
MPSAPHPSPCPAGELAPLDELLAGLRVVQIPMRVRFRGIDTREVALVRGPVGWGEFGPFLEYGPAESSRWLAAAVEAAWHGWPEPVRGSVPVNATVPAVPASAVPDLLSRYAGCTSVKVKVAERGLTGDGGADVPGLADDLSRVAAVREVLGRGARIRVDANGGWSVDQAVEALGKLAAYELEYAEQPCASVEELAELRQALARAGTDVPVAADESIRKAADPLRVVQLEAADLIVVKVAPLGGVRAALRVVEECGLPAVVSSAIDTSVGLRAGVALAAALPDLPHACGLGTLHLMAGDVTAASLLPERGAVPVRDVIPEEDLVRRWEAPPDRQEWWRQRVRAAAEALSG